MLRLFSIVFWGVLFSFSTHASCLKDSKINTLEGVIITKMIKMDPADFGWVPADGLVSYRALVVKPAICVEVEGIEVTGQTVLHLGAGADVNLPEDGRIVQVTGQIFEAHTAHHHEQFVFIADQVVLK